MTCLNPEDPVTVLLLPGLQTGGQGLRSFVLPEDTDSFPADCHQHPVRKLDEPVDVFAGGHLRVNTLRRLGMKDHVLGTVLRGFGKPEWPIVILVTLPVIDFA